MTPDIVRQLLRASIECGEAADSASLADCSENFTLLAGEIDKIAAALLKAGMIAKKLADEARVAEEKEERDHEAAMARRRAEPPFDTNSMVREIFGMKP